MFDAVRSNRCTKVFFSSFLNKGLVIDLKEGNYRTVFGRN